MIPSWCAKYVGIPFSEKGNTFAGCNCWGLFWLIYKNERNIDLPKYTYEYQDTKDIEKIAAIIKREADKWEFFHENPQVFDAIVLRINAEPWHIGCVVDPEGGKMLHIERYISANIESYSRLMWQKRKIGFYRYVG